MSAKLTQVTGSASLLAALGLLAACGGQTSGPAASRDGSGEPSSEEPSSPVESPDTNYADIDGPFETAGLKEVAAAADLVVMGKVTSIRHGASIGDPETGSYAMISVSPTEVLKGRADGPIEVAFEEYFSIEGRPMPEVGDDAIWLLSEIAREFTNTEGYVLVNSASVCMFDSAGRLKNEDRIPLLQEAAALGNANRIMDKLKSG
jgi:hypothetical protein